MSVTRFIKVLTFLIAGVESELRADVSRFSPATFTHLQPLERLSSLTDQASLKNMNSLALET